MPNITVVDVEESEQKEKYAAESCYIMEAFIEDVKLYQQLKEKYQPVGDGRKIYQMFKKIKSGN
jgi:hypothetical protein